mmetsp:Transcript_23015/g.40492  ORF Transcript_23015/g.40492 Transcript_23015/m.40492 type:complete len:951 (-) Transcript_23015:51-2903(-)
MPRDGSTSVRAVVRVRPLLPHEIGRGDEVCCEVPDAHSILIQSGAGGTNWRQYTFDACLSGERTQKQVFQESGVSSLLDSALLGYSSTVLAYGQTGSGKTHTMIGRIGPGRADGTKGEEGLIARGAKNLFKKINAAIGGGAAGAAGDESLPDTRYTVSASFIEIFNAPGAVNECICDLLNPQAGNLQVRHNKKHGFFVSDLCVVDCQHAADVRAVLEAGVENRRVAAHALNKDSSRSHALFTLYIDAEIAASDGEQPVKRYGKICFVDLAGSERLKESAAEGHTRKETQAINKSLFTLGQVISQLASGQGGQHVPYRNSKLTQLLQESFGGEALCLMVTCISPAAGFLEESLNSLKYATKAMNICNRPVVRMDERQRLMQDLRAENASLRKELDCYRARYGNLSESMLLDGELQVHGQQSPRAIAHEITKRELHRSESANAALSSEQTMVDAAVEDVAPSAPGTAGGGSAPSRSRPGSRASSREAPPKMRRNSSHAAPGPEGLQSPASNEAQPKMRRNSPHGALQSPASEARSQRRGRSEPPRGSAPPAPPPPAPAPQLPPGGRGRAEAAAPSSSYAMAAAKRRLMAEERKAPPARKKPSGPKGASLPPIPRAASSERRQVGQQVSPSAATPTVSPSSQMPVLTSPGANASDAAALQCLRRGNGMPEVAMHHSSADGQRSEAGVSPSASECQQQSGPGQQPLGAAPVSQSSHVPSIAVPPAKAVPIIAAPPSTKALAARQAQQAQLQERRPSRAMPELTKTQIERLDSAHWTEWQFEFGTPANSKLPGKPPSGAGSRRSSPASRGCPGSGRSAGSQPPLSRPCSRHESARLESRPGSRPGSRPRSQSGARPESRCSARSSSSGSSSLSSKTSPSASRAGSPRASIDVAAAPTTASGSPAGSRAADAAMMLAPGMNAESDSGHPRGSFQHMSLAELNSKLSSMQMATSALL